MTPWVRTTGIIIGGAALSLAAAVAIASFAWNRATARAVAQLRARNPGGENPRDKPTHFTHEQLAGLPAPVARYFEFALRPGQALIRHARLIQRGTFAQRRDTWAPFSAVEDFEVWPPGFVWDARIRMAPLVGVRVRDSYLGGNGMMNGKVAGLVTVVQQGGTPEMATGSLLRYLAEAAWLPTALLPSAGVQWQPIDDSTARATLTDAGVTASMEVRFGARGEIERIYAKRHRDVNGTPVLTRWEGRFWDYAHVNGMMVPTKSEVGWWPADGWLPYWRGSSIRAEYEWAER